MNFEKMSWYSWMIVLVALIVGFLVGFMVRGGGNGNIENSQNTAKPIATTYFTCAANKNILAQFWDASVAVRLSDGRIYALPQTVSASGARYANTDESVVFWNKGETAFVEESGVATYVDCNKAEEVSNEIK